MQPYFSETILQPNNLFVVVVSFLFCFFHVNGACERNVIPTTKRGDN